MKRIITVLAVFAVSSVVLSAQDKESEECYYGPHNGDFSCSFDIMPTINFIGNMFNGTTEQSYQGFTGLSSSFFSGTTLSSKYYLTDRLPISTTLGVNWYTDKKYAYSEPTVVDEVNSSGLHSFLFMVGSQYLLRPGKRLQPVLGGNIFYSYVNSGFTKTESESSTENDTFHWNPSNYIGIVLNFGVEFYLYRNVSLSACVDMGLSHKWTVECVDDWDDKYSQKTSSRNSAFLGKLGSNLAINFYF